MDELTGVTHSHPRTDASSAVESIDGAETSSARSHVPSTRGEGFNATDIAEYNEWAADMQFD